MHPDWETTEDIEVLREALRWQGTVTHIQDDRLTPRVKALANVRDIYLRWESEFTNKTKTHEIIRGHVAELRQAIRKELGEEWP